MKKIAIFIVIVIICLGVFFSMKYLNVDLKPTGEVILEIEEKESTGEKVVETKSKLLPEEDYTCEEITPENILV